jgi:signal transduction histidine kinase
MRRRDSVSSICRLLSLAAAGAIAACAAATESPPPIEIRKFEYLPDALTIEPPPVESRGEPNRGFVQVATPVKYPYRWLLARVTLPAAPTGVYALYVSGANRGVTAYVNRVQVGSTSVSDAETFGWNYPIFFTVPQSLLRQGENTLEFRMKLTNAGHATIRGVQLAEYAALKGQYDRILFWRVTGPQITTLIAILIGGITLLMFIRRPSDTLYGWFAAAALLGALRNGHFFIALPISEWSYEIWALVPLQWMCVALVIFAFRLCHHRFPRLERALLWVSLVWSVAPFAVKHNAIVDLGYLWLSVVSIGTIVYAGVQCWRAPKLERVLLLLALIVTQVFGALDLALLLGLRSGESRVYLMPYSVLLFSVVIGAVLVDAFAKARARQEEINRELDERLAERERELNVKHQQVLRLERERTATGERQRILRDIHDGLGSQLVSSIQLVEHGELAPAAVADVLRECVDDLRLAIDSLKPAGDDLLAVLGNFRYRMEPRLAHAGVRLDWRVDPEASSPALSSEQVLHTLRIVQEAVTNALKHAKPTRITLALSQLADGAWTLEVRDDGAGFVAPVTGSGDGLANMKARASRAGLRLEVRASAEGTVVQMGTLPIS